MPKNNLYYQIAITLLPGIGDITGRKLISYCGGVEAVFKEKKNALLKIPGIGQSTIKALLNSSISNIVETEMEFIEKHQIKALFYTDSAYPKRLNNCEDSPMLLYYKGSADLNSSRIISIVGTRNPTTYGKQITHELIKELKSKEITVISGLAYGIDSIAHNACIKERVPTIGVLGHGLDRIYPSVNRNLAGKMIGKGGLLTEFTSGTNPDRENFPKRNRIVAGMSDAVIIIESAIKGGAMITADIANSYNRDVFAIPGRLNDTYSAGCNRLIKINKAALAESANDIAYIMGWDEKPKNIKPQRDLFFTLKEEQQIIYKILADSETTTIDNIIVNSNLPSSVVSTSLLEMEFEGLVISHPGKRYSIYK